MLAIAPGIFVAIRRGHLLEVARIAIVVTLLSALVPASW